MDALLWLLGFVALVPLIFWFKKATGPPPDPDRPLPPKQANLITQLDAEAEWLSAYGTLPEEEQERRREEFQMRFLDHSTRLLNAGEETFGKSNTPLLWASSRIKELVAAGKTFSDACTQAMDEMEAKFPRKKAGPEGRQ